MGKRVETQCEGLVDGGLVDDERCPETGSHFLCNRDEDQLMVALARDCPDDPLLQVQIAGWFCGEHAGHILGHYPMMKEIEA